MGNSEHGIHRRPGLYATMQRCSLSVWIGSGEVAQRWNGSPNQTSGSSCRSPKSPYTLRCVLIRSIAGEGGMTELFISGRQAIPYQDHLQTLRRYHSPAHQLHVSSKSIEGSFDSLIQHKHFQTLRVVDSLQPFDKEIVVQLSCGDAQDPSEDTSLNGKTDRCPHFTLQWETLRNDLYAPNLTTLSSFTYPSNSSQTPYSYSCVAVRRYWLCGLFFFRFGLLVNSLLFY